MKIKKTFAVTAILLLLATALNLTGCKNVPAAQNLMAGIESNVPSAGPADLQDNIAASDFAIRLFKACSVDGQNTLVSPLSVLSALAMTLNGAKGDTRSEMEAVLGMAAPELNSFFKYYMSVLPNSEKYKLSLANSIWFTSDDRFTVNNDFLQTNADYYGADVMRTVFNDAALKNINNWVKEKTDGMIPSILDNIREDELMYLINALAFDAEWEEVYEKYDLEPGSFQAADGSWQQVDYLKSKEKLYLEDENVKGFIKYFSGRKYAFVALLPKEGRTAAECVDALDGQKLNKLLTGAEETTVKTKLPRFETEYSTVLNGALESMGMVKAFDGDLADFTGLGTSTGGNIYISRVIHKTFISVSENGARAGAATVVAMAENGIEIDDTKTVYLERPFIYMLIDTETSVPFFIGTFMTPEK
jgi:serpin B